MNRKAIQHLYWRAGFGLTPYQLNTLSNKDKKSIVDELFIESNSISPLQINTSELDYFTPETFLRNKNKRRDFVLKNVEKLKEFNYAWIHRLMQPKELLRERMTLFWANHFACHDKNIYHIQKFNNTLREHALGDFRDFVKAVSKEAAMIKYLNSKQNKKLKPNENFARELMELFTLGVGNYSEEDIKESARAFTGYSHDFYGNFIIRKRQHDYGFKSFFGKMGRYDGDDIIDIILDEKQCAKFICEKIYKYFVNDHLNENHIQEMANVFYKNYNIEALMRFVFNSDWFYNEDHIGTKIKSPIDFLVGINNVVPIQFEDEKDVLKIQKLLGQILLHPPNVAGWKGGKNWIDSNTILLRLKLPSVLLNNAYISTKKEGDFNDRFKREFIKKSKDNLPFKLIANWTVFNTHYNNYSFTEMTENLLSAPINNGTKRFLNDLIQDSKKEYCVQLMSLPEYQMC